MCLNVNSDFVVFLWVQESGAGQSWSCLDFRKVCALLAVVYREMTGVQWLSGHRGSRESGGPKDRCACKNLDCLLKQLIT